LVPASQIDDGEPPKPQTEGPLNEVPFVIGSAVKDGPRHPVNRFHVRALVLGEIKLAGDAAHGSEEGRRKSEVSNPTSGVGGQRLGIRNGIGFMIMEPSIRPTLAAISVSS